MSPQCSWELGGTFTNSEGGWRKPPQPTGAQPVELSLLSLKRESVCVECQGQHIRQAQSGSQARVAGEGKEEGGGLGKVFRGGRGGSR